MYTVMFPFSGEGISFLAIFGEKVGGIFFFNVVKLKANLQ